LSFARAWLRASGATPFVAGLLGCLNLRPEKHLARSILAVQQKRTKSPVFGLSSTVVRSISSKIFRVIARARLHDNVQREIGASRCRFDVSTAFRGSRLLCLVLKPTCFDENNRGIFRQEKTRASIKRVRKSRVCHK
jgi:hypothetical protein